MSGQRTEVRREHQPLISIYQDDLFSILGAHLLYTTQERLARMRSRWERSKQFQSWQPQREPSCWQNISTVLQWHNNDQLQYSTSGEWRLLKSGRLRSCTSHIYGTQSSTYNRQYKYFLEKLIVKPLTNHHTTLKESEYLRMLLTFQ